MELRGVHYHVERGGEGSPLLLLHGFTGSAATWRPFYPAWQKHFHTIAVDMLGHGQSDCPADPRRYRMEEVVADLLSLMDALQVDRTNLLGYSMGGRVALHLAAAAPQRISRLVLVGASPGIASEAERAARVASDERLARMLEEEGIEAFVNHWENIPLFASQKQSLTPERQAQLRSQRLSNQAHGLAGSLRGLGTGQQEPLHERLDQLTMPALLITGEWDEKYCNISREMAEAMPSARREVVSGAGHAVHLEQPELFEQMVLEFLQSETEQKG